MGSVFFLLFGGSIAIGMLSGEHGYEKEVKPFIGIMFFMVR
jgi:hypothetical protein